MRMKNQVQIDCLQNLNMYIYSEKHKIKQIFVYFINLL